DRRAGDVAGPLSLGEIHRHPRAPALPRVGHDPPYRHRRAGRSALLHQLLFLEPRVPDPLFGGRTVVHRIPLHTAAPRPGVTPGDDDELADLPDAVRRRPL